MAVLRFGIAKNVYICTCMDETLDIHNLSPAGAEQPAFPAAIWLEEVDPADQDTALSARASKPNIQSNSKHALPFGAQICTARTYSVF